MAVSSDLTQTHLARILDLDRTFCFLLKIRLMIAALKIAGRNKCLSGKIPLKSDISGYFLRRVTKGVTGINQIGNKLMMFSYPFLEV